MGATARPASARAGVEDEERKNTRHSRHFCVSTPLLLGTSSALLLGSYSVAMRSARANALKVASMM